MAPRPPAPAVRRAAPRGTIDRVTRLALTVLLASLAVPSTGAAQALDVEHERLSVLLDSRGFEAPERFKALVGLIEDGPDGAPVTTWFDFRGTATDRDDWWPASTVKLYAAIAALERSRAMAYPPSSWITYHYVGEDGAEEPVRMRLSQIIDRAIVPSDNRAFDQLVELAGFDWMHRHFFTERNGLGGTVFLRAYGGRHRDPRTGHGVNRLSPRITIEHGRRSREIEAREGTGRPACPDQGNCTTLFELAEAMRRVMLHERLPETERFRLGDAELEVLRDALGSPRRPHGTALVTSVESGFGGAPIRIHHKPGYAYRWVSDVMLVHRTDTDQRWLLAAAAWGGRRVLDDALVHLGAVMASGELARPVVVADATVPQM